MYFKFTQSLWKLCTMRFARYQRIFVKRKYVLKIFKISFSIECNFLDKFNPKLGKMLNNWKLQLAGWNLARLALLCRWHRYEILIRVFMLSLLQEVIWAVNTHMFGLKRSYFPHSVYIYLHSIDWGYWRLCCHTCVWLVQIRPDWIGNGCVAYCISPVACSLPCSSHSCILQTMNKETRGNCVRALRSQ